MSHGRKRWKFCQGQVRPTSYLSTTLSSQDISIRFIPENASVYIAPYVIHRDSRYFSPYPDSFIPERWLSTGDGKFTTNLSAFIPFSVGFANCVGKNLALMEMRMVVAAIVQRFDIEFAEGYDPARWEEDLQDFLAMRVGELPVVLHARG